MCSATAGFVLHKYQTWSTIHKIMFTSAVVFTFFLFGDLNGLEITSLNRRYKSCQLSVYMPLRAQCCSCSKEWILKIASTTRLLIISRIFMKTVKNVVVTPFDPTQHIKSRLGFHSMCEKYLATCTDWSPALMTCYTLSPRMLGTCVCVFVCV